MTRTERQDIIINKLLVINGTVECFTGFGKSRIGIETTIKANISKIIKSLIVVVPTIDLKDDWIGKLQNISNLTYKVLVVNGIVSEGNILHADVIIYDEIHKYLKGEQFSKVFKLTKGSIKEIGLTATLSNEEKNIVNQILPIVDTVSLNEGIKNKWVTDFISYNLFIDFQKKEEREEYDKIHQMHNECFAYFNQDFETANKCSNKWGAEKFVLENKFFPNKSEEEGGGRMSVSEATKFICEKANIWKDCVKKRSNIINTYYGKLDTVIELVNKFSLKYITFGIVTETCDILTEKLSFSKSFHSNIESEEVDKLILIDYDLAKPNKKEQQLINLGHKDFIKSKVKCGKDRLNTLYKRQLSRGDINGINTAAKADLGLDIPGLNGIFIYGRNSKPSKNQQRGGRGLRKEGDKFTLIVDIIIKNTKDESWLKSAQWGTHGQVVVNSIEELVKHFNSIVK